MEVMKNVLDNKIYLLLHGAWHAKWCWELVLPIFINYGCKIITPDLPGHGDDKTPFSNITLKTYVDDITRLILSYDNQVTLIGHSMAGIIISQLAENIPEKIEQLIYVAAFIPGNNESLLQEARKAKTPGISTEMVVDEKRNEIVLKKTQRVKDLFFNACEKKYVNVAMSRLQSEPFQPFIDPISITEEKFGKIKKLYIECLLDEALRPEDQKRMYSNAKCDVVSIAHADHSPFYSAPLELVDAIVGKY